MTHNISCNNAGFDDDRSAAMWVVIKGDVNPKVIYISSEILIFNMNLILSVNKCIDVFTKEELSWFYEVN